MRIQRLSLYSVITCVLLCVSLRVLADTIIDTNDNDPLPWFTGPLLAPAGVTMPKGHMNFEPYFFWTDSYGTYSRRWKRDPGPVTITSNPTMIFTQGLTDFMDYQIIAAYTFNSQSGASSNNWGDTSLSLGFQLLRDHGYVPALRFTVQETFPSGKHDHLDPSKLGTDSTGAGSYQTTIGLNFQKLWHLGNHHFYRQRLSLAYIIPLATHLSGTNTYGGAPNTNGTIHLGKKWSADLGFEYTLTQKWVPALDLLYTQSQAGSFTGNPGTLSTGLPAPINTENDAELSIAPAMEYNFTPHLGAILGAWTSLTGENARAFTAVVGAVNYYY